jgi:hypothetical protein|nr:MAG TPA: Head Tail Connector Protein [Caudoviricetes sp.]
MEAEKLKKLLGITGTEHDEILEFIIGTTEETILNYCNIDVLPEGLTNTAYRMAMDLYRYDYPGDTAPVAVTSISEGDTSTSFANASDFLQDGILKNYKRQLNRYRKLRW